jgi:predicted acetyltransferase
MDLVIPSLIYKKAYLEALQETLNEKKGTNLNKPRENQSFEEFVQEFLDYSKGKNLPEDRVPATMFWIVDQDEVIGRLQIRHELNDYLHNFGGHIGYYIKPSKRKMGYGKKALSQGLIEAKKLGLERVLITTDDENIGSQRIIEANGGVLENKVEQGEGESLLRRYWITLP